MAVRSRLLLPDITVRVASGEMDVVSRQSVIEAVADAVILQEMAGGFISVAVQRQPTGAPNEMVTVSAMVEWKDRTDAKTQPEARAECVLADDPQNPHNQVPDFSQPEREPKYEPENAVLPFEHDSPDGLDESLLQDEDVPESVR
jgi:hypothetical protein